jgi:hypothetical protein
MSERTPVRPAQVTIAAGLVMAGSVIVVLMAFSQVTELRSLDTREAVEEYLSKPPGDALGLGLQDALSALRAVSMIAAACAAATAILGFFVLQRDRRARVALSVLAVPLFLSGLVSGGLASAVVAAAIVMLWFQPSRDWFDGRTPAARERPPVAPPGPDAAGQRDPLLDLPPPSAPPLHPTPYGSQASSTGTYASPPASPYVTAPVTGARPATVRWACVLTWVFSALAFVMLALTLAVMLAQPDTLLDEAYRQNPDLAEQGLSDGVLRATVYATSGVVMSWSIAAVALAVLAWRRVRWAARGLVISAAVAGALCLLVVVGSALLLVPLVACGGTVALMLRPESRRWYAGSGS